MPSGLSDTDAATLEVMAALYARMTPAEKLRRVRELTLAASQMALAGLRLRHPDETEGELMLRLARLRLGPELVALAYPPSPPPHGS